MLSNFEAAVEAGQLNPAFLLDFDTTFKLYLWQICGGISLVDEGHNYNDIALKLIKLIIPNSVDENRANEICNILKERNIKKL